jgi:maltose O-acetyltransferase
MLSRAKVGRWLRRAVNRVRGEQNVDHLIAAGLQFGEGAHVMRGAYIDPGRPWLIRMGSQSGLSPGATVLTHDDSMRIQTGFTRIAPVEIGERVFVGAGATILPGTRIGDESIIAAGAVVSGEIPAGSIDAGHPGQVIATVKRAEAWQRQTLSRAPVWPMEGWSAGLGITEERKAEQREALAVKREGYVERPLHRAGERP